MAVERQAIFSGKRRVSRIYGPDACLFAPDRISLDLWNISITSNRCDAACRSIKAFDACAHAWLLYSFRSTGVLTYAQHLAAVVVHVVLPNRVQPYSPHRTKVVEKDGQKKEEDEEPRHDHSVVIIRSGGRSGQRIQCWRATARIGVCLHCFRCFTAAAAVRAPLVVVAVESSSVHRLQQTDSVAPG